MDLTIERILMKRMEVRESLIGTWSSFSSRLGVVAVGGSSGHPQPRALKHGPKVSGSDVTMVAAG